MKKTLLILAVICLLPIAAAETNESTLTLGATSKLLTVVWSFPDEADVGSFFWVTSYAQIATGSLVINQAAPSTWIYEGCTYISGSQTTTTLSISSRARVRMDAPTCTIIGTTTEGLLTLGISFPMLFEIRDTRHQIIDSWPNLNTSTTITSWPTLNAALTGTLTNNINGNLGVTGDINASIDGDLALSGGIDANLGGTVEVTGVDINTTIESLNQTFQEGSINAGGEAQEEFIDYWLPLILMLILLFTALWHGWTFAVFGALVGLIGGIADIPFSFNASILVIVLAWVAEYLINWRQMLKT